MNYNNKTTRRDSPTYDASQNAFAGSCSPEARSSEIPRSVSLISEELSRFEKMLAQLRDRLQPILSPAPISAAKNEANDMPSSTPLGHELLVCAARLSNMADDLESIYQTIEL